MTPVATAKTACVASLACAVACAHPTQPVATFEPRETATSTTTTPSTQIPTTGACVSPDALRDARDADVDGDGTPDKILKGYSDVTIYVSRGGCFALLAKITPGGPVAFVSVVEKKEAGVRDLSIDTWLFHGDRARTLWSWTGHAYESSGAQEEIPGPHLPRPR